MRPGVRRDRGEGLFVAEAHASYRLTSKAIPSNASALWPRHAYSSSEQLMAAPLFEGRLPRVRSARSASGPAFPVCLGVTPMRPVMPIVATASTRD